MADAADGGRVKRRRIGVVHDAPAQREDEPIIAPLPPNWLAASGEPVFAGFKNGKKAQQRLLINDDSFVRHEVSSVAPVRGGPSTHLVRYAVGVYDPAEKTLRITDAPVLTVTPIIKSIESMQVPDRQVPLKDGADFMASRKLLGETFGTKKLKAQLRAQERNQVDVSGLQNMADVLEHSISEKAAALPTLEDIESDVNRHRTIPPFDAEATNVSAVYPLSTLAPEDELALVPYKPLLKIRREDVEEMRASRAYPDYVLRRLLKASEHTKKDRRELQLLLYLTYLLRFRNVHDTALNQPELLEARMGDTPPGIVERFVQRFTDVNRSLTDETVVTHHMTPRSRDLITSYALAVWLHIEQFTVDPEDLAGDLKLTRKKMVEYLRALGCQSDGITAPDSTPENPKTVRVMRLKVPLQFPKPRRGPPK